MKLKTIESEAYCVNYRSGEASPGLTAIRGGSRHSTTPTMTPGRTCLPFKAMARSFSARVAYLM